MCRVILYIFLLFFVGVGTAQVSNSTEGGGKQIKLIHSDFSEIDENQMPGVKILKGNVEVQQDSMKIFCTNAYLMDKENYVKLYGNVRLVHYDTLTMTSEYAEYNGVTKVAFASGNVVVKTPNSTITSQKIYYNRAKAEVYYDNHATIKNKGNTLKSKVGRHFVNDSKFEFRTEVVLTNPKTVIKTNHLDYFDDVRQAYVKGPSTITNEGHFIYTEDGFYDTRANVGKLIKNSYILYDGKRIEADDLYYERDKEYFRGKQNVKVTDTINKSIAMSHFAEVFRGKDKDSVYITDRPLLKTIREKDSVFYYSKEIFLSGKDKERVIVGKKQVRMFQEPDLSALADSLHYDQKKGLMELMGLPVVFRGENQITGEKMELLNDVVTEKLDSLKVLKNAFLIERDTLGTGYNQAKSIDLFGRFVENELVEIDLIKNSEMIYHIYDDGEYVGVDKSICSRINIQLENQKIVEATRFIDTQSTTYPPKDFPESEHRFEGFNWRAEERIHSKEEIFPKELRDDIPDDVKDAMAIDASENLLKELPKTKNLDTKMRPLEKNTLTKKEVLNNQLEGAEQKKVKESEQGGVSEASKKQEENK